MDIRSFFSCVDETSDWLRKKVDVKPRIVIVLSAGLGDLIEHISGCRKIATSEIPNFPVSSAEGHKGELAFGELSGVPVAALSGRVHYYEGYSPHEVVFPYFVLAQMGAKMMFATNAAGGVKRSFKPGDLMLVADHINMMGINPLIGITSQRKTDQFTSMTNAYDAGLVELAQKVATKVGINLKKGVYLATSGPSYETKSEVRAARLLGGDAVGMSTVPEVIAANYLGMKVLCLSCIANPAADLHKGVMTHTEVLETMNALSKKAIRMIESVVEEIGRS